MKLLAFCLLLGMSAQGQTTNLTGSTMDTYTFTDGYCSLGQKIEISHGTGDLAYKETLATCGSNGKWWKFQDETEFAEAAQRAADETDLSGTLPVLGWHSDDGPPHKPWDEVDGQDWPRHLVPAESVDVPAVQVKELIVKQGDVASDPLCRLFARNTDQNCRALSDIYHSRYTCADKSRVLLTSEDGKKHCIKFLVTVEGNHEPF